MVKNRRFEDNGKLPIFGVRHLQCFLLFWGITFAYAMRVNMALAIVAMTDNKSANKNFPEYAWSEKVKSLILSSFFWGYVSTQIIGGHLARKFGGKFGVLIGVFLSSVLAILTPLSANIGGWPSVVGLRVLQGMSQGMLFPTTHTLLAKWSPENERTVLGTYCYSGSQFGTVVMLASSGFIVSSSLGWPGIFYISGGCGVLWTVIWYLWGASSPSECNAITIGERNLIESSLPKSNADNSLPKTPWLQFFSSPPFWALILAHSGFSFGYWTLLSEIPAYMKNILKFNIKSNALLTSLPYFAMLVLGFVFTAMATCLQKYRCLNLGQIRKIFNTLSSWVPALAIAGLGYADAQHTEIAIFLLVVAVGFSSAMHIGFQVNHIDLSPNFAGILIGITNTAANVMSALAPITVGFLVNDEKNPLQWRMVFFIAAGICFITNLFFIIFGSATVQPWNEPKSEGKELQELNNRNEAL